LINKYGNIANAETLCDIAINPMFKLKERLTKRRRTEYILGFIFGAVLTVFLFSKKTDVIDSDSLASIGKVQLTSTPSITTTGTGRYKNTFLLLVFSVNKRVTISGLNYHCADIRRLQQKSIGEILEVFVKPEDLQKIGKEQVEAYSILENGLDYCDLACRNSANSFNQTLGIIAFSIISIGCLVVVLLPYKLGVKRGTHRYYTLEPIAVIVSIAFLAILLYKVWSK